MLTPELDADSEFEFSDDTTILIVEDDPRVRAMARRVLAGQAYRILEAVNGADAIRVAIDAGRRIDAVLTEVETPTIGVRAMLARLRQLNPSITVLFMSGHSDEELLSRGFDKGHDPFLAKPFNGWELVAAVEHAMSPVGI